MYNAYRICRQIDRPIDRQIDQIRLDQIRQIDKQKIDIQIGWIRLDQIGSDWIRLDQIGLDWIRLDYIDRQVGTGRQIDRCIDRLSKEPTSVLHCFTLQVKVPFPCIYIYRDIIQTLHGTPKKWFVLHVWAEASLDTSGEPYTQLISQTLDYHWIIPSGKLTKNY